MDAKKPKLTLNFAAIDRYVEQNIVSSTETHVAGRPFVIWGDGNYFPDYIYDLYMNVSTLHSVIDGTIDFVCGDSISVDSDRFSIQINNNGDTIEDLFRNIAKDMLMYGGFAVNIVRNRKEEICGLYHIPLIRLRTNEDKTKFYYSTDWAKSYGRVKYAEYEKYDPAKKQLSSVYYYSNNNLGVYPISCWVAATKACEIEKHINNYHLNTLNNGFTSSYIINFNNGIPTDEQKAEAERYVNEKLAGSYNAGRILLSFAEDKDHAVELIKLETEDYGEKYSTLVSRTKQEIFTSFRATPNLFGLPTETTGFNSQEYAEAFKLYNKTVVQPIQKTITRIISKILNVDVNITPFDIDDKNTLV